MWQEILHADQQLLLALNGSWGYFWDWFFYLVTAPYTWIPMWVFIIYRLTKKWGWKQMLLVLLFIGLSVALADQVANFFKTYTPKFRPTHTVSIKDFVHTVNNYRGGLYGTVSGHSATSFAIAVFLSLLFKNRRFSLCILFWASLVAFSRIYLGVHFPLDIFFGTSVGILIGWGMYRLYCNVERRIFNGGF